MKIIWFTWKDKKNPSAGGAEVVGHELARRLVKDGHEVTFLVPGFPGALAEEWIDGIRFIRLGNKWSIYWKAYRYYLKHLRNWPDLVIDEYEAVPFFTKFYVKQKKYLIVYHVERIVWLYQMFFPVNVIGYLLEPLYLRLLNGMEVLTISKSTEDDLLKLGFKKEKIHIIGVGTELEPVAELALIEKYNIPTVLALGSVRPMKRTAHIIKAFELAKERIPTLQLVVSGDTSGAYGTKVLKMIAKSKYVDSIKCLGRVSSEKKIELMKQSHVLAVTSVREGWGLVVTEANSQGTPAVVYNIPGLRDSVIDGKTGLIAEINNPKSLAQRIVDILEDKKLYSSLRQEAWGWSKTITFDNSYKQLISQING